MNAKIALIALSLLTAGVAQTTVFHVHKKRVEELEATIKNKDRVIRNYQRTIQRMGKHLTFEELIVLAGEQLDDIVFEDIVKDI